MIIDAEEGGGGGKGHKPIEFNTSLFVSETIEVMINIFQLLNCFRDS